MNPSKNNDDEVSALYLDLVKRTLLNLVFPELERHVMEANRYLHYGPRSNSELGRSRRQANRTLFGRASGKDWPLCGLTMIGLRRLNNVQRCIETVVRDSVPGDLIEAGVWRGGASIWMRAVLKTLGVRDRIVWLADSFQGLPPPDTGRYPQDRLSIFHLFRELSVPLPLVRRNFRRFRLLDSQVRFIKGFFADTLKTAPIERLALIRLDGDLYQSTMESLEALHPKLQRGGFVIVDDYFSLANTQRAVDDYRLMHSIRGPIVRVDWSCGYWRRD